MSFFEYTDMQPGRVQMESAAGSGRDGEFIVTNAAAVHKLLRSALLPNELHVELDGGWSITLSQVCPCGSKDDSWFGLDAGTGKWYILRLVFPDALRLAQTSAPADEQRASASTAPDTLPLTRRSSDPADMPGGYWKETPVWDYALSNHALVGLTALLVLVLVISAYTTWWLAAVLPTFGGYIARGWVGNLKRQGQYHPGAKQRHAYELAVLCEYLCLGIFSVTGVFACW